MWLYLVIAALLVGVDQLTKWIVVQQMTIGQAIEVIPNFFYLNSYRNRGAAWGMLEGKFGFFFIVTVLVVVGLIYFLYKEVEAVLNERHGTKSTFKDRPDIERW